MQHSSPGMDLLAGAVDCHVHACPHINSRRLDVFEAVRQAAAAGMAGIGLMDNFANSSGYAALAQRELGSLGVDIWGGLIMEPPAGGINAEAVHIALKYGYGDGGGARFISMPTHHTRHVARQEGRSPAYVDACFELPARGAPSDPLPKILDLIAEHDAVFNLGHLSDEESVRLAEFAQSRGVRRLLVPANHAAMPALHALVRLGAHLEFSFFFISPAATVGLTHVDAEKHTIAATSVADMAARIAMVPSNQLVLSSDSGVALLAPPVESLRMFLMLLRSAGVSDAQLRKGVRDNPAALFGIRQSLSEEQAP